VDLSASYRTSVAYEGQTFTPAQLGAVGGAATLSSTAPFVGLGFDNTFTTRSRIGVKLLAGVAFSRQLQVELHPTSGLATVYPQVSAGLTFKF
jgi:hypothetical protein